MFPVEVELPYFMITYGRRDQRTCHTGWCKTSLILCVNRYRVITFTPSQRVMMTVKDGVLWVFTTKRYISDYKGGPMTSGNINHTDYFDHTTSYNTENKYSIRRYNMPSITANPRLTYLSYYIFNPAGTSFTHLYTHSWKICPWISTSCFMRLFMDYIIEGRSLSEMTNFRDTNNHLPWWTLTEYKYILRIYLLIY